MSPKKPKRPVSPLVGGKLLSIVTNFNHKAGMPNEHYLNLPETERKIAQGFRSYLVGIGMPLAAKNFDAVLDEKSGQYALRDDGTISWYHELIPILLMIELAHLGKKGGGFNLSSCDPYGGLEVAICTHLRHDSIEDHLSYDELREQLKRMRMEIAAEQLLYDMERAADMCDMILSNVDVMSQKRLYQDGQKVIGENGRHLKEDVKKYVGRMIYSDAANPFVFMFKQLDIAQNLSTLFGAGKFDDSEKRIAKCNAYEDMYGPRYGFTDAARNKWQPFSSAIKTLDDVMGFILYPHFRYLESVDLAYPDKEPTDNPVGISRYLNGVFRTKIGQYVAHVSLIRMAASVDPQSEPEKAVRLDNFINRVILPSLGRHGDAFSYLKRPLEVRQLPPLPATAFHVS